MVDGDKCRLSDPELFFVSDSVTVSEGGVMAEVCLRLSVPLSSPLTVPLTIGSTGTSATAGIGAPSIVQLISYRET